VKQITLETLTKETIPGITSAIGAFLAEAAQVCLEDQKHPSGIELKVCGIFHENCNILWARVLDAAQIERCWNDEEKATEYGAYGIAILLIFAFTDLTIVRNSRKGPGIDYWLGNKGDPLFQNKARLEVSGIRQDKKGYVAARVKQKIAQVSKDRKGLPAYIIIVEFSTPLAEVVEK
jgi:hypothetical protein